VYSKSTRLDSCLKCDIQKVSKCCILWCFGTSFHSPTKKYENLTNLIVESKCRRKNNLGVPTLDVAYKKSVGFTWSLSLKHFKYTSSLKCFRDFFNFLIYIKKVKAERLLDKLSVCNGNTFPLCTDVCQQNKTKNKGK
jgi:hypothetical protein